jgi:hypothetical protein
MIVIDKAVLHVLDFNAGSVILSNDVLSIKDGIEVFLLKHIEKSLASQDAKLGVFYEDSECKKLLAGYLEGKMDFVLFSKEIAHMLEQAISHAEEMVSADLIICDAHIDDVQKIIIFKCSSQRGFVHQVSHTPAGFQNDIVNNHAILPNPGQKIEEFAIIDVLKMELSIHAKKYTIDGNSVFVFPELLLECSQAPSQKETIKKISQTVKQVAEAYGQDNIAAAAAMKSFIAGTMEVSNELDPREVGKAVFDDNPAMQSDYIHQMQEAGFTEPAQMDQESTLKKMRTYKLKTDTGIELTIPTDYFENTKFVEFKHQNDGSIIIVLKNVMNLINKG